MSIDVMNHVWKSTLSGPTHRFVLLALADRADDDGYCWPGVANIVRKTGFSESSVKRSIRHLESEGLLEVAPRWTVQGDRDSNAYRINVERLAAMLQPPAPRSTGEHVMARHFPSSVGGWGHTEPTPRSGPEPSEDGVRVGSL